MEDNLNLIFNGKRPNFFKNGRIPQQKIINSKNNGCGNTPGNQVIIIIILPPGKGSQGRGRAHECCKKGMANEGG